MLWCSREACCVCAWLFELVDSICSDVIRLSVPPEPDVWQLYRQSIVFFFVALVFRFRVRRNSAISNVYCYIWRHAVQFQAIVHASANCAVFLFKAATGVNCTKSLFDSLKSPGFVQLCSTQMLPVLQSCYWTYQSMTIVFDLLRSYGNRIQSALFVL